jgi:signal transduction histidine kinase
MRLVPQSLFGRMVLILVAGLLLAQIASVALLLRDRGEAVHYASGLHLAQRIVQAVHLLDHWGPAERARIVRALDAPPLRVTLLEEPDAVADAVDGHARRTAIFTAVLRRHLGEDRPMHVAVRERPPLPQVTATEVASTEGRYRPRRMARAWGPEEGPVFTVQARLQDGTWVRFSHRVNEEWLAWPQRLLLTLGFLLVTVVTIALLAVRWLTRPLSVLAGAAEQLGRDLQRPPLIESGPIEVRRAARAFNGMQRCLVRYVQDRTRVLAAVSHDLKTPITRLRLRAESLEDPALRAKVLKDLDEMESMVAGTLEFMRSVDSQEPVQPVDVGALLESLQADAEETGRTVHVEGAAAKPYLGRPLALKRCLGNLIDNALYYGARATVHVADSPTELCITIADEGPGIPEEELQRVFEPFHRVESSRSRYTGGTGLGLGIARNLARAHGGEVHLHNRAGGKGLQAIVALPR